MDGPAATKRRTRDGCGTALALELAGDRWSLLIMRELLFGPRRFGQIAAGLHGISGKVLTERLEGLETAGIVIRRKLPPPAAIQVYDLTRWGRESEWTLIELSRWGTLSPFYDPALPLSTASLMLSLRVTYDPDRAAGLRMVTGFWIGEEGFVALVSGQTISIQRADPEGCDAVLVARDAQDLAAVMHGGAELGRLTVRGSRAMATLFVKLFPLPTRLPPHAPPSAVWLPEQDV